MHLVKPCSTNSGVPSCGEVHAGDLWWAAKGRTVGRGCVPPHRKWGQGMGLCPSPELHAEKVIFGAYFVYVCYFLTTARWTDTLILCRKVTWDEHNPNASQYKTKFWFTWKHDSRKLIEMTFFCCKKKQNPGCKTADRQLTSDRYPRQHSNPGCKEKVHKLQTSANYFKMIKHMHKRDTTNQSGYALQNCNCPINTFMTY